MRTSLRQILVPFILFIVVFFAWQATIQSSIVVGSSMEPNFEDGQRVLVNKVLYHFHEPERGDVVILHPPISPSEIYIKRIIGLPGESVEIKQGKVYIHKDDEVITLDERYVAYPPNYTVRRQEVPENEYFVLGDNRPGANDSHNGWTVPRENIIGKAWLSIWPLDRWGAAFNYSFSE